MNRKIELSASLNSTGYCVGLKINGCDFFVRYHLGSDPADMMSAMSGQLKTVYGDELYTEYWRFADIHAALSEVRNLIISLGTLHTRLLSVIEREGNENDSKEIC